MRKRTSRAKILFFALAVTGLLGLLQCTPVSQLTTTPAAANHFASASTFQLAAPTIRGGNIFFEDRSTVELSLPVEGARMYYTLDGSEPTKMAKQYKAPLILNQSATLKVRAFHPEFQPSAILSRPFIKLPPALDIESIQLNREPHPNYTGTGARGLIDRRKGSTYFRSQYWMGFDGGELVVDIEFPKDQKIGQLTLSLLSDQGSWIFLPESVSVEVSKSGTEYLELVKQSVSPTLEGSDPALTFVEISLPETVTKYLKIKIKAAAGIPDWHPGAGSAPWLFIDEILVHTK